LSFRCKFFASSSSVPNNAYIAKISENSPIDWEAAGSTRSKFKILEPTLLADLEKHQPEKYLNRNGGSKVKQADLGTLTEGDMVKVLISFLGSFSNVGVQGCALAPKGCGGQRQQTWGGGCQNCDGSSVSATDNHSGDMM